MKQAKTMEVIVISDSDVEMKVNTKACCKLNFNFFVFVFQDSPETGTNQVRIPPRHEFALKRRSTPENIHKDSNDNVQKSQKKTVSLLLA